MGKETPVDDEIPGIDEFILVTPRGRLTRAVSRISAQPPLAPTKADEPYSNMVPEATIENAIESTTPPATDTEDDPTQAQHDHEHGESADGIYLACPNHATLFNIDDD